MSDYREVFCHSGNHGRGHYVDARQCEKKVIWIGRNKATKQVRYVSNDCAKKIVGAEANAGA